MKEENNRVGIKKPLAVSELDYKHPTFLSEMDQSNGFYFKRRHKVSHWAI